MDRQKFIINLLLILCLTAIVVVSVVMVSKRNDYPDRFSVTATGKVYAKPDVANLTVGVKTDAKSTAATAVKENTNKMNEIVKALKALGIEEKDIKTSSYNLNPVYDWTNNRQTLRGYEVYQTVTIKIRNLDKIGDAIAKTTEKGANQVGNISFTIDDEFELKAQARDAAIERARTKAEDISRKTGMKLGKIVNVYENQVYYPSSANYALEAKGLGIGGGGVPAPDIQTGENEVSVEIVITYEVK